MKYVTILVFIAAAAFGWGFSGLTNAPRISGMPTHDVSAPTSSSGSGGGSGSCASCLTGLVAYYAFESTLTDAVAGTYTGAAVGTLTYPAGKVGNAVSNHSDPANSEITIPALTLLDPTDWSVALWVYREGQGGAFNDILTNAGAAGVYITNGTNVPTFYSGVFSNSTGAVPLTTWVYLIVTYDSTANLFSWYIDNVAAGTNSLDLSSSGGFQNAVKILGNGANYADGRFDEMGVWSKILNGTERTSLFNGGSGLTKTSF